MLFDRIIYAIYTRKDITLVGDRKSAESQSNDNNETK